MHETQAKIWSAIRHLWPAQMRANAVQGETGNLIVSSNLNSGRLAQGVSIRFSNEVLQAFHDATGDRRGEITDNAERIVRRSLQAWVPALGFHADPLVISVGQEALIQYPAQA